MQAWIYGNIFKLTQMLEIFGKVPNRQQFAHIKHLVFILCLIPLFRLIWLGFNDGLSANPVEFIERSTGYWALVILLATLSLTPIRLLTGRAWQLQLRRMLGLYMFFYACLHLTIYLWLDYSFIWSDIIKDIIKHPYVLVGSAAFLFSIPLAVTSNHLMIKKLRERWKPLHKAVYVIAVLAVVHFLWLVKKDLREPMLFIILLALLLGTRVYFSYIKPKKTKV